MYNMQSHFANFKMHRTHARTHIASYYQNGFRTH
jgi:hypothetical protein